MIGGTLFNGLLAAQADVLAYSGASFPPEEIQLRDAGDTPYNITGQLVEFLVKSFDDQGGSPLISLRSDVGSGDRIEVISAASGTMRRIISQTTLAALQRTDKLNELTAFRYEFFVGGVMIAYGNFYLKGDVR